MVQATCRYFLAVFGPGPARSGVSSPQTTQAHRYYTRAGRPHAAQHGKLARQNAHRDLNLEHGPGFTVAVMSTGQVTEPLTVGQLAARAAVRTDTIRYYEREGLLPAPRRTDGDHRRYGPPDLDRLLFIRGAQRLGLRLAEIRDLLAVRDTGTCPCEPAEVLLRRHVAEIGTEIKRLAALRAELLAMLAAMPGPDCPDPLPGTWCPPNLITGKEATAMCPCCGTSTCDGSCCDGERECC
jgi:DNA-binding transcriptional MerR regulator